MPPAPDVLIIGGGVIGLTTAYCLAREGVRVAVLDKSDFGQEASWAGAGIIPPGDRRLARTPFDQLRALSSHLLADLSEELRTTTGIDNGYSVTGGLVLIGEEGESNLEEWRPEGIAVEELDGPMLHRFEPALAPELRGAFFLSKMAQVRNPRHLKALLAGCRGHGVELRPNSPAQGFERQGERITAVKIGDESLRAGRFVLTAGAWSDALLEPVGWKPGIHPVRGQIALLNTGEPLLHRILLYGKRYLVPRLDGRILIGSTEEHTGFDKHTTAEAVHDLLALAIRLVPGLAEAPLERCWAGLRPGSPDGLPFLGAVPGLDNLLVAAGHFRAGIQLSPATGLLMKELLLGQKLTLPLEPFRLDRPGTFRS